MDVERRQGQLSRGSWDSDLHPAEPSHFSHNSHLERKVGVEGTLVQIEQVVEDSLYFSGTILRSLEGSGWWEIG